MLQKKEDKRILSKVILFIVNALSFLYRSNPSIFLCFSTALLGYSYLKSVIFAVEKTLKSVVLVIFIDIDILILMNLHTFSTDVKHAKFVKHTLM